MDAPAETRPHGLVMLGAASRADGVARRRGRGQNFLVDWIAAEAGAAFTVDSEAEAMLLLPGPGATIAGAGGDASAPGRSVCILPAGRHRVRLAAPGVCVLLRSAAVAGEYADAVNAPAYAQPDPAVAPPGAPWACRRQGIAVIAIDTMVPAAGRPRLKMLQSATLSINWVEYDGARDRSRLSPHHHDDFEQGSLAIEGDFIQHLRLPWGSDADRWRDDLHLPSPAGSLTVVPPGMIHTTEGVGEGRHLLIDIFCPPRADFVAKGWVANSGDYAPP